MIPPFVAQLRVYEPLHAFGPAERRRWADYLRTGQIPGRMDGPLLERAVGLGAILRGSVRLPRPGDVADHAYVTYVEGAPLLCPWRTAVRCWRAAAEVSSALPDGLADAVLPADEVAWAAESYAKWSAANPAPHTHILTNSWAVPPRWYLLFDASDRRLRLGSAADRPAGRAVGAPDRSMVYVTTMAAARRRMARTLASLRGNPVAESTRAQVLEVSRWLEDFHPHSLVELDYAGLVHLLGDDELRADESPTDVAAAVAAMGRGDLRAAAAAYDRVITRWRMAQLMERAN